jgi:hypothetical protein
VASDITIVTTPGDADANSYADLDDAEDALLGRLDVAAWSVLNETQQSRCLILATQQIDSLPLYGGVSEYTENTLHFPTDGCYDEDTDSVIIPAEVVTACIELAVAIASVGQREADIARARASGIQSFSEGAVSVSFAKVGATQTDIAWASCPAARKALKTESVWNDYQGWLVNRATCDMTL